MDLSSLSAEFPRDAVHWRAQTLTRDGDKALALAYLDARDVMDRLDGVCGPENWQSEITETARGRVICRLGIMIYNGTSTPNWVWKSDGAGDTAVEGEKGGISDALKRAAVHWGVGRYLYRMPSVWVPCETYTNKAGKKVWKAWRVDPWTCVRGSKKPDEPKEKTPAEKPSPQEIETAITNINGTDTLEALQSLWSGLNKNAPHVVENAKVIDAKDIRKGNLTRELTNQGAG